MGVLGVFNLLCAVLAAAPPATLAGRPHLAVPGERWTLAWSDEFGGTRLDASKWTIGLPWMGDDGTNRHHNRQYASTIMDDDVAVRGGSLHLTTRRREVRRPSGAVYQYTEGLVTTSGKFAATYGYFEVRARLPVDAGPGTWPAFWLLAGGWPPEMDVIEYWGSHNRIHQGTVTRLPDGGQRWDSAHRDDVSLRGWHTYGLEWGPGYQRYSIDSRITLAIHGRHVPAVPHYLLLNSGIETARPPGPSTRFPNDFEVDWVRVYSRPDSPALLNGGFEGADLRPWTRWNAAAVVDTRARSGKRALRLDVGGALAGSASAQQAVFGLVPGARYHLTGRARCEGAAAARMGVKDHGRQEARGEPVRSGRWQALDLAFTVGDHHDTATVYCWAEGEGSVLFDDVRLVRSDGAGES